MPSFYIIIPWAIFFNAQFLVVNINSFFFLPALMVLSLFKSQVLLVYRPILGYYAHLYYY